VEDESFDVTHSRPSREAAVDGFARVWVVDKCRTIFRALSIIELKQARVRSQGPLSFRQAYESNRPYSSPWYQARFLLKYKESIALERNYFAS